MIATKGPVTGSLNAVLSLLFSIVIFGALFYLTAYLVTCHGPCGNKEDDALYDMRAAACCNPDITDCGTIWPGEGSTWLQGICSEDFCNPLKKDFFNGCSKCAARQPALHIVPCHASPRPETEQPSALRRLCPPAGSRVSTKSRAASATSSAACSMAPDMPDGRRRAISGSCRGRPVRRG
jgi:hypothetical protein